MPRTNLLIVIVCLLICGGRNSVAQEPIWRPYFELEGRAGSLRQLGQGNLFLPLSQDDESLLFADFRGLWTDNSAAEGNWGLGYRKILPSDWIVGAHLFYDLRSSEFNNTFHQGTAGVELLDVNWGFRANGYIPDQGVKNAPGANGAFLQGGNIVVRPGLEAAYWGVDFEAERLLWFREGRSCSGSRLGALDAEFWAAAGVFHFDNDATNFENITGPRVRTELRLYDLPILGDGSRLVASGQYEYDDVRGSVGSGMLTVRIPFGSGSRRRGRRLRGLNRRMVAPIVRDVDIITNGGAFGAAEAAKIASTGQAISQAVVIDGNTVNPEAVVAGAGVNSVVIASGAAGTISPAGTINMNNGQTLLGGGSQLAVIGCNTGTAALFTAPGSTPVIDQASNTTDVISLADNTAVFGTTIQGGRDGLSAIGAQGSIVVQNNTIQNSNRDGISIDLSGNQVLAAHIENNRFVNVDDNAIQTDVQNSAVLDLSQSIVGNTFLGMNNTDNGISLNVSGGGTITASIRDNTFSDLNEDGVFLDIDDSGVMITTITNNQFLLIAEDGVEVSVEDHDDENITQITTIANNQFTDITGAGVRIESNENDSDSAYLVNQVTTITGNTFLRNGTGVALQYDSDSDADDGEYISNTTITNNKFMNGLGDGINLDVNDWDDEDLTVRLGISNNQFLTHAGNAINLNVADIDLDSDVVNFLPTITGNTFAGTALDNILINVSDEALLTGVITGNTIVGGVDGIDITSGGDGPNTVTIGGNSIDGVTGTGIQFDSANTTTIQDLGSDNTVTNFGLEFNFDNQGNLTGTQMINGTPRP